MAAPGPGPSLKAPSPRDGRGQQPQPSARSNIRPLQQYSPLLVSCLWPAFILAAAHVVQNARKERLYLSRDWTIASSYRSFDYGDLR